MRRLSSSTRHRLMPVPTSRRPARRRSSQSLVQGLGRSRESGSLRRPRCARSAREARHRVDAPSGGPKLRLRELGEEPSTRRRGDRCSATGRTRWRPCGQTRRGLCPPSEAYPERIAPAKPALEAEQSCSREHGNSYSLLARLGDGLEAAGLSSEEDRGSLPDTSRGSPRMILRCASSAGRRQEHALGLSALPSGGRRDRTAPPGAPSPGAVSGRRTTKQMTASPLTRGHADRRGLGDAEWLRGPTRLTGPPAAAILTCRPSGPSRTEAVSSM